MEMTSNFIIDKNGCIVDKNVFTKGCKPKKDFYSAMEKYKQKLKTKK